jgi:hypothetical protein
MAAVTTMNVDVGEIYNNLKAALVSFEHQFLSLLQQRDNAQIDASNKITINIDDEIADEDRGLNKENELRRHRHHQR